MVVPEGSAMRVELAGKQAAAVVLCHISSDRLEQTAEERLGITAPQRQQAGFRIGRLGWARMSHGNPFPIGVATLMVDGGDCGRD